MNSAANTAFIWPQNSKSDAMKNSSVFMVAMSNIWTTALVLGIHLFSTHTAIPISAIPISMVSGLEKPSPKIRPTICSCLGTKPKTLQARPFANHTATMKYVSRRCAVNGIPTSAINKLR